MIFVNIVILVAVEIGHDPKKLKLHQNRCSFSNRDVLDTARSKTLLPDVVDNVLPASAAAVEAAATTEAATMEAASAVETAATQADPAAESAVTSTHSRTAD